MQQRTILGLGASAAAALAFLPASAGAQTAPSIVNLAANGCVPTSQVLDQEVGVQVAGFSPESGINAVITKADGSQIAGGASGRTDAAGNGVATGGFSNASEGTMRAFTPGTLTASVTSLGLDQVQTPPVAIPVTVINSFVATTGGRRTGSPRRSVTWSFGGFTEPGQPIYAHVRFAGRTVRNFRFGTAGACGTLERRAPALPTRSGTIRAGRYFIQFDSSSRYRRDRTKPSLTYRVFTTFRPR